MLIELKEPPTLGSTLEIRISGIEGSIDAPEAAIVYGEVRHQMAWNFCTKGEVSRSALTAVGVRFVEAPALLVTPPPGGQVH